MNGVEQAARYAFPPNNYGYCGPKLFVSILKNKHSNAILKNELKKFKVHYAYLSLIAKANNLKPFDKKVVHAFWIGNELLENVSSSMLRRFIVRSLFPKGKARAKMLAANLPKGLVPHHSFNSLYVNFVTGKVKRSIKNYDSCCITFGKVLSISNSSALVLRHAVAYKKGKFILEERKCKIALERRGVRFVSNLKKGDIVSVHWGLAIEKLGKSDFMLLKKYTQKNIEALNAANQNSKNKCR